MLICEHLALVTLGQSLSLQAASSSIYRHGKRTFLEVVRFDRHGEFGRSAVCTWAALDAALFGMAGEAWTKVGVRLATERYIGT